MYRNCMKFGHVVFEIYERTDRHTDAVIVILRTPSEGDVKVCKLKAPWSLLSDKSSVQAMSDFFSIPASDIQSLKMLEILWLSLIHI